MKQGTDFSFVRSHNSHEESSNNKGERRTYFLAQLNFPAKLDRILQSPQLNDIICWLPHGRSWRVMQPKRFEKEVLPVFFRHCNYSSFVRQVNGWGFRRIQSGPDFNSYYHESFLRDDREAHQRMRRPTVKEIADRKKQTGDPPPDFYTMIPVDEPEPDIASQKPPPAKLDLYAEVIAMKLSRYSKEGQGLLLHMELVRLETHRRRVIAALQTVDAETIQAVVSPVLSQQQHPMEVPPLGTPFVPTHNKNNNLLLPQRTAREMLLQLHHNKLLMCAPHV